MYAARMFSFRTLSLLLVVFMGWVEMSRAAVFGTFEKVADCGTCLPNTTYPAFDTWIFKVRVDTFDGDSMSLNFKAPVGGFFDFAPGTSFRDVAANPVQANVEIPETFIVVPTGANPLYGTLTDTTSILQSDYTTSSGTTLVPAGNIYVAVAFFSVPSGTQLGAANFLSGVLVAAGDPIEAIRYEVVPEPTALSLVGIVASCACLLHRGRFKCFAR